MKLLTGVLKGGRQTSSGVSGARAPAARMLFRSRILFSSWMKGRGPQVLLLRGEQPSSSRFLPPPWDWLRRDGRQAVRGHLPPAPQFPGPVTMWGGHLYGETALLLKDSSESKN